MPNYSNRFNFQAGDRIVEIDGINLRSCTYDHAVEIIQKAKTKMQLVLQAFVSLVSIMRLFN